MEARFSDSKVTLGAGRRKKPQKAQEVLTAEDAEDADDAKRRAWRGSARIKHRPQKVLPLVSAVHDVVDRAAILHAEFRSLRAEGRDRQQQRNLNIAI